ncbi:hypothetical protein F5B22DRAFT_293885 [Xylaria bambusicola]|uniref:uncharacterized protein n=1 Tax=Xylaria bambusicola TaxID=326684 RepID=UPI002008E0EA|nr:uncharacterized protein F5B22DRAFT_293885 [Xylaria bambusicola]KAI0512801.1 hypothetical protein F5B22DRAFT_293885 [Xylaria bambusicola]
MALNATYTDAVKAAVATNQMFEGQNATEYLELLNRPNVCLFIIIEYENNIYIQFIYLQCHHSTSRLRTCDLDPGMARHGSKRAEIVGVDRCSREPHSHRNERSRGVILDSQS